MNSPEIKAFIRENSGLFWWMPADKIEDISLSSLVEAILNYGDEPEIKKLFDLVGIETVADLFYRQTAGPRTNYKPRTKHFFTLYFKRHAPRNSDKRAS